jgi:hypothetical protein
LSHVNLSKADNRSQKKLTQRHGAHKDIFCKFKEIFSSCSYWLRVEK